MLFKKVSSTDLKCVWSSREEMAKQNCKPRPLIETPYIKSTCIGEHIQKLKIEKITKKKIVDCYTKYCFR